MRLANRSDLSVRYVVASLVAGVFFDGLGGGVLVSRTLLGDATPTDAVAAE